jgi:FixJ family two-component response regulator
MTPREQEIVKPLACNNDQIAALFVSKTTVERQRVDISRSSGRASVSI